MGLENAISMEPIRAKLKNLREVMPNQEETLYTFGSYLADRLNPELVPAGFYMAAQIALYDLQTGVDGFSGEPIQSNLVGCPPQVYANLNRFVPQIAEAVCPPDFAEGVKKMDTKVNKK